MTNKPIFLFAFANDDQHSLKLKEEEKIIRSIIDPLHDQKRLEVHYLSSATVDQVYQTFNRFHNRIALFHYSGHSGNSFLNLEDKEARTSFISILMGMQKELRLVFLNGCSNLPQVKELNDKGVENIIATSVPINDQKAVDFSKYFYEAFANNANLNESFIKSKARLQNDHPTISIETRGVLIPTADTSPKFPWGLYALNEEKLGWTIPQPAETPTNLNTTAEVSINYPDINKELVELAFEGMSKYNSESEVIWQLYQKNPSPTLFNMLQNTMLDSFPTSLGIQLRDLFTPEGKTKGRLRLQQINETYLTLAKLMASISLANLWEKVLDKETFEPKKDFVIRDIYKADLEKFLNLNPKTASNFDYVWLIATISRIFSDNKIQPFIDEFKGFHNSLKDFDEVYDSYRFLEQNLRLRLLANDLDVEEVEDLCHRGEHALGVLLQKCAFLCSYQLVTIKDIGVLKSRRSKDPMFLHTKSILKGRDYATIDHEPVFRKGFTSNNSVVVTKNIQTSPVQLNLSPFVIDENAFKLQEDKLPKIHYFKGWVDPQNIFYEHAEMLNENFVVEKTFNQKKYKDLDVLLEQFEQFRADLSIEV